MVSRRRLFLTLRLLREQTGLSVEQVAAKMDWSDSKGFRIESGIASVSRSDLTWLLDLYGASDRLEELLGLVRLGKRRRPAWVTAYRGHVTPTCLNAVCFETEAARIAQYNPVFVPSLLWSRDYARLALNTHPDVTAAAVTAKVELHVARQLRATSPERDHQLRVIVDERTLRPTRDRVTMRDQIDLILTRQPRLDLAVLPQHAPADPTTPTGCTLYEFADPGDPDMVYLDDRLDRGQLLDEPSQVAAHRATLEHLYSRAARGEQARQILLAARDRCTT